MSFGLDKGYLKQYEKCSRCNSLHEDVFVRDEGCPTCRGKSEAECKAIAAKIKKEAAASKRRHAKWRRHREVIAAYDAVAENEFLTLSPKTPKHPLCKKCQVDKEHRHWCEPCRNKTKKILDGK